MNPEITRLIDRYLSGELTGKDLTDFETRLASNEDLRNEVNLQRAIEMSANRAGYRDVVEKASKKYKLKKNIIRVTIFLAIITLSYLCFNLFQNSYKNSNSAGNSISKKVELDTLQEIKDTECEPLDLFALDGDLFYINPKKDTSMMLNVGGTTLHLPAFSFINKNGENITTTVTLKFKEYRNAAQMAFSNIPMFYTTDENEFLFNSSGMFSIEGFDGVDSVFISPEATVIIDYALVQKNENTNFYLLNEDYTNWIKLKNIEKIPLKSIEETSFDSDSIIVESINPVTQTAMSIEKDIIEDKEFGPQQLDTLLPPKLNRTKTNQRPRFEQTSNFDRKNEGKTQLVRTTNAGHTYPDIVTGLQIKGFGVYNCDQQFRIKNRVRVQPQFITTEGVKITNGKFLCLIDLNYNSSFSYNPRSFNCDKKGRNYILLYTTTNDLYTVKETAFKDAITKSSIHPTFIVENQSKTILNTSDLEKYLGL